MSESPSQRWSSAVFDLFACARGRLPAPFLERRLADLGLTAVKPLAKDDLPRFEQAVELVGTLIAGRPAPGGQKPDAALNAAFPEDHPTLGGLKPLALAYVEAMRPAKGDKRKLAEPTPEPARDDRRRPQRGDDRGNDRGRGGYGHGGGHGRQDRSDGARPAPAPRPPRIRWEAWLDKHLAPPTPAAPIAPAADGSAAAPAPVPAPAPAAEAPVWVPPSLAHWLIDNEGKRHLARIRDRVTGVVAAKADPTAALRELAFALLRPPLGVRDDLRGLIHEHLAQQGVTTPIATLFPPPALAALKRDWEELLAARGPADPAVDAAWRKLVETHPDSRAKLEAERAHELDELTRRFATALRQHGEADPRTAEVSARLIARHASGAERIGAEIARAKAIDEAIDRAGQLVATHGWESAEVAAAAAALDPQARHHLEAKRRHELDELDRRLRAASREHGPAAEPTMVALQKLRERFPTEGAAAAARLERFRRGDDIAQQERERRESGRSLSSVHLGGAEHRLTHLRPANRWRLVVAVTGLRGGPAKDEKEHKDAKGHGDAKPHGEAKNKGEKAEARAPRRNGHAVAWLISDTIERSPVPAGWRAPEAGSLDELDAAVQAVVDRDGGVLGLPLADCPDHGSPWADAVRGLATIAALAVPVAGPTTINVELPQWAELTEVQLDDLLTSLSLGIGANQRQVTLIRATPASDAAGALAEAVAWTWHGRKDADAARNRQSGLPGTCLLQPNATVREVVAQLASGALPAWPAWGALVAEAASDSDGLAAALLAQVGRRIAANPESLTALHRHLTGQARSRIAEPARLARELAWFETLAPALRPRDRLRLDGAALAAQAAAGRIEPATVERLNARLAELREDWPAEVLEAALHAAVHAREGLDLDTAEAVLAPWARAEAVACGGRPLLARLCEERARIAAAAGKWKDARKQLDRGVEAASRCVDAADRDHGLSRLATLRAAVLADDATTDYEEALAALAAVIGETEPSAAAAALAVSGTPRHAHGAVLRWAVRRQDETVAEGYLGVRPDWSETRDPNIAAMRAVVLASSDADAAKALLSDVLAKAEGGAAQRLSLLACAVAAALRGAALPDLRDRLATLRRDHAASAPSVAALERALALAPDTRAGLAEALPLLAR